MRSRLPSIRLILLLLLVASTASVAQNAPTPPYSATVPVPDTSSAQRNHAFEVALTQVLTQTAGHDLSQQPGYGEALGKASNYVTQYQYQKDAQDGGFSLQVSFDPSSIHSLVRRLGSAPAPTPAAGQAAPDIGGSGTLWVDGIHSADAMARLLAALHDDAQVVSVQLAQAGGHGVMLHLQTRVSMNTLTQGLISQGVLAPDPAGHPGADASARWTR